MTCKSEKVKDIHTCVKVTLCLTHKLTQHHAAWARMLLLKVMCYITFLQNSQYVLYHLGFGVIQQGCIKLLKHDSKDIYNITNLMQTNAVLLNFVIKES